MIQVEGIFTGGGVTSAPIMGTDFTWTGGDNICMVLDDGGGNWRIKFLSSGIFTPLKNMVIDVFLVGAGGGLYRNYDNKVYRFGGGGGYTKTVRSIVLAANTEYPIVIGAGGVGGRSTTTSGAGTAGGYSSAFGASVDGGDGARSNQGGNGGSGAGGRNPSYSATPGSDGSDASAVGSGRGGTGQGTTTREFGESAGTLYSTGGSAEYSNGKDGDPNTGDGGDAAKSGSSGICIVRQHKEAA